MQSTLTRWGTPLVGLCCLAMLYLIITTRPLPDLSFILRESNLQSFKTLFLSIILEALPFMLLGVVISSLLHLFVSEETVRRLTPRHPVLGVLFACLLGFVFPVCECGMIPVVRRLMRKGMPVYIAVVFILAGPVLNPVVYASTYMAFRSQPEIAYARMGLSFAVAAAIGLILYRTVRASPLRWSADDLTRTDHAHFPYHEQPHDHRHHHGNKLYGLFNHASDEFFEMGKYLILGAMITAAVQTLVARETLLALGSGGIGSHLFMAGFAYVLSLCSTSDAFVASSFAVTFSKSSLLTFLVFGPMADFKSTLMMLSVFKARFVVLVIALVTAAVVAGSMLAESFGLLS